MKYGCSHGQHPKAKAIPSRVRVQNKQLLCGKNNSHLTKQIMHSPQSKLPETSDREIVSYTRALR